MGLSDKQLIEADIEAYLRRYQDKELLRFVAVGSVDDGKSTLIGRLLLDTGSVYQDQLEAVRRATQMQGTDVDLSLLTDGLAAEREQGITIDVAYRYFSTDKRKFIIADTPGHVQYTRNMVTGASTANVALILIDARLGVLQQSRRHAYIASLLGIPHLAACVNKMDLVDYDRGVFAKIQSELSAFAKTLSFDSVTFFPISALEGENCVRRSAKMGWYSGPTVLEFLETVPVRDDRSQVGLRYPVQTVLRPNRDYRGYAGRICSGTISRGDPIMVLPSGKTSRVKAIDSYDGELSEAFAPQSVVIRLDDEIDVSRGDMLVHPSHAPHVARGFEAHLVWMREAPLDPGRTYLLKHTTQIVRAEIQAVRWRKDMDTLEETPARSLDLNDVGRAALTTHRPLYLDAYEDNRDTGSFILIDTVSNDTVAAGMVIAMDAPIDGAVQRIDGSTQGIDGAVQPIDGAARPAASMDSRRAVLSQVTARERRARFGVAHGIVVIVGDVPEEADLLAYAVERRLFDLGASAAVIAPREGAREAVRVARGVAEAGLLAILPLAAAAAGDPAVAAAIDSEQRALVVDMAAGEMTAGQPPRPRGASDSRAAIRLKKTSIVELDTAASIDAAASLERRAAVVVAALRDRGWMR